ncbi:MAG: hypothetical protein QOD99_1023, partial [Chthoniobacter sp.]|nr:hypothetical protein [Chthoniobacter sp.]
MATKPSALVDTRVIYCGDWHASFYVKVLARLVVMGLVLPISSAFGARAEIEEELQRLPVPVETKSDETDFALNDMRKALAPVHPAKKQAARVIESKDKPYILYGDLFHTGRNYALAELSEPDAYHQIGVGFAEWNGDKWEPRGLWHISPNWRPKGWKESDDDHLPITPAERPFWLMDFNGKGAIGVVMVGEVWKYWQENVLFKFDAKQHGLVPIEDAMGAPRFMHGWVRLYFNSGHRAIYEEWRFLRWNGDRFAERSAILHIWRD